jgi:hypothetical protein
VVGRALTQAGLEAADVASVELGRPDGLKVGLGGRLSALARLHLTHGRVIDQEVRCNGVDSMWRPWCVDDPQIVLHEGVSHDVPCTGEPPAGCATPIVVDPEAVAKARPLRIAALDVPIGVGHHEIPLGQAIIPNGYLDKARFQLADMAPDGVYIPDGIFMRVSPTDPSRPPLGDVYGRGRYPGVETVEATLVFDVETAPPGAILQVRDVVVQ